MVTLASVHAVSSGGRLPRRISAISPSTAATANSSNRLPASMRASASRATRQKATVMMSAQPAPRARLAGHVDQVVATEDAHDTFDCRRGQPRTPGQ